MLSESMNTTRNFVFVVLVASQGIIGGESTLDSIKEQTDDVLDLTTLNNRKSDDEERTGSTKDTTNTTEEQTLRSDDNSSVSYPENDPVTTAIGRNSAASKEISEDTETSDADITTDTSHHSSTSHTVEHSIRKDISNNNEIEVSEKNASDKKTTIRTADNATADDQYVKLDTTTEQPFSEPIETTAISYDDDDIDDYVESKTDQQTEKNIKDFLSENEDIDLTKFYRRMFELPPSLEDSNTKPETVTRTSTTITSLQEDHSPLIQHSYEDRSRMSHTEKSHQSYGGRQNYPTSPYILEANIPPASYLNSRSGQSFTPHYDQPGSLKNERRFTQARPHFDNNQRFINNQNRLPPMQFMQQSLEQLQPQLYKSMHPYLPQPQQHYPMQLQYPWPTVQPVPNNMDNIFTSLQQASLHPVLSAKQYKDFYEKQYF